MKSIRLLLLLALASAPALAEVFTGKHAFLNDLPDDSPPARPTLSILFGGSFPTSDLEIEGGGKDDIGGSGSAAGLQLFFPVNDRLSLGLDYMFDGFGRKTSDALVPRLTTDYKVSEQTFLFAAKAAVLKREKLTPFLFAGLGLHIAHAEADVTPQPGIIWLDTSTRETRRILDDSDTAFAAAFGLGADYRVGPVLSLGIETRYQYFSEIEWQTRQISGVGNTVSTIEGSISAFALLARATFHF